MIRLNDCSHLSSQVLELAADFICIDAYIGGRKKNAALPSFYCGHSGLTDPNHQQRFLPGTASHLLRSECAILKPEQKSLSFMHFGKPE